MSAGANADRGAPSRRATAWRWLRRGLLGLGALLVLLLLAVVGVLLWARSDAGRERLRQLVLENARQRLPGLDLERIGGGYLDRIELRGVVLRDRFGGEALRVDRLELRYDLGALWHKQLRVERLALRGVKLTLRRTEGGKLNLAELVTPSAEPPEPSKPTSWTVAAERIELRDVAVRSELPGARYAADLSLQGQVRLERGEAVRARLTRLEVATKHGGRAIDGQLSALLRADPRRLRGEVTVGVSGLLPGTRRLKLRLGARGPWARLAIWARLSTGGGGRVKVSGTIERLLSGRPRFDVAARVADLAAQRLLRAARATDVDLQLRARGAGRPLVDRDSRVRLTVKVPRGGRVVVDGTAIDRLALAARLDGRSWRLERCELAAAGARLSAKGSGTTEQLSAEVVARVPRLSRLPWLRRVASGAVRVDASVSGPLAGPWRARARVRGDRLAAGAVRLRRLRLSAVLRGLPRAPRGRVAVTAEGLRGLDRGRALEVSSARIEARGTGRAATLRLSATGPRLHARLALDARRQGRRRIAVSLQQLLLRGLGQRLRLRAPTDFRVSLARQQLQLEPTRVAVLGGELELAGTLRGRGFPRAELRWRARGLRVPGRRRLRLRGRGSARLGRRQLALAADARLSGGGELRLRATLPVRYAGGTPLPRRGGPLQIRLRARKLPVARLAGAPARELGLGGIASLELRADGTLAAPRGRLALGLRQARAKGFDALAGDFALQADDRRLSAVATASRHGKRLVRLELKGDTTVGALLRASRLQQLLPVPLRGELELPGVALATLAPLLPRLGASLRGDLRGKLTLAGTIGAPRVALSARLERGKVGDHALGSIGVELSGAAAPAELRGQLQLAAADRVLIEARGALGVGVAGLLRASGGPSSRWQVQARAELPRLPLALLAKLPLAPQLEQLAGELRGTARVGGTLGAPRASARVELRRARFGAVQLGDVHLAASGDRRRLHGVLRWRQRGGGYARGRVDVSLPRRAPPRIDAALRGRKIDVAFVQRLAPVVLQRVGGRVAVDLRARGALPAPRVEGSLRLNGGRLRLRGQAELRDIELQAKLSPELIRLTRLKARSGDGRISAWGKLALRDMRPRRFSLTAAARRFRVDAGPLRGAAFSGQVNVDGRATDKRLRVKVLVRRGELRVPKIAQRRRLQQIGPLPDVVFVDAGGEKRRKAARKAKLAARRLLARVEADPFFVRGEELDIEVALRLKLSAVADQARLEGRAVVRRGEVKVLGRPYEVRRASVAFTGRAPPNPAIDVQLARRFAEATVLIGVRGTGAAPELELTSDPPVYDRAQIISLILTGHADSRQRGGESDPTMAIAAAVSQALIGSIARRVVPWVGLDVARVGIGQNKDPSQGDIRAEAEVGKYLTERIYVGYRRVFGASEEENANEALMEYRISSRWLLMLAFGDAGVGGLDVFWTYRY